MAQGRLAGRDPPAQWAAPTPQPTHRHPKASRPARGSARQEFGSSQGPQQHWWSRWFLPTHGAAAGAASAQACARSRPRPQGAAAASPRQGRPLLPFLLPSGRCRGLGVCNDAWAHEPAFRSALGWCWGGGRPHIGKLLLTDAAPYYHELQAVQRGCSGTAPRSWSQPHAVRLAAASEQLSICSIRLQR